MEDEKELDFPPNILKFLVDKYFYVIISKKSRKKS